MAEVRRNKAILGTGWGFPVQFNRRGKLSYMVSAEEDIEQALRILFSTVPGERVMQPAFGCGLREMVFENISDETITRITDLIERAILFHEPRIDLEQLEVNVVDELGGLIEIELTYTIRGTNTRSNMVYPFYFLEGTQLGDLR
jgi:phage baseplate assembly protein W